MLSLSKNGKFIDYKIAAILENVCLLRLPLQITTTISLRYFFLFLLCAEIKSPFKDDNSSVLCIYFFIINRQALPLLSVCVCIDVCAHKRRSGHFSSLSSFCLPFSFLLPSSSENRALLISCCCLLLRVFAHNRKNLLSDC